MREVLESGRLRVESELDVLHATSCWVRHVPAERSCHIVTLLKCAVRLLLLSIEDLVVHVERDAMVQASQEAQQVVMKAMRYVGMAPSLRVEVLKMPAHPARRATAGGIDVRHWRHL